MATLGVLSPFDPVKDDFDMWNGTFNNFLVANGMTDPKHADRCVGIFLSSVGITTYSLLSNLLSPVDPSTKKLNELQQTLKTHFKPAPKAISERYKFSRRTQKQGETVAAFVAALRSLAVNCKFTDLEIRIRDQFIFGLLNEYTQRQLFTKDDNIALPDVISLAIAQEAAEVSTALVRGHQSVTAPTSTELDIHKMSKFKPFTKKFSKKGNSSSSNHTSASSFKSGKNFKNTHNNANQLCNGCGSQSHTRSKCPHRESKCFSCGTIGHLSSVCKKGNKSTNHLTAELDDWSPFDIKMVNSQEGKKDIIKINVKVNGVPHTMEFDTGAQLSVLSAEFYNDVLHRQPPLQKSNIRFRTYTNQTFHPLGNVNVEVEHQGQKIMCRLPVTSGSSLFGKDFLKQFKIDWSCIQAQCHNVRASGKVQLQTLMNEYKDVFQTPTKTDKIRGFTAHIILKEDATPRFLKARPLPYAIKGKVDKELDTMESTGVISKVETSEWASPLVVVPKADGRVRITGDFKHTVNPQLCITQYPLAVPDDLFATVSNGNTYSKLDGTNAYHQINVDDKSKRFLVINTHRGLFMYNTLPQGIASSPAIFQQFMDTMLMNIPQTGAFVDDAITTGSTDEDHLQHLRQIFDRMRQFNYKLSPTKCQFMKPSIEFLGHQISSRGIHTTQSKVHAIVNMPAPKDASDCRSFLGLLNFYHKFLNQVSSECEPIYRLTRQDVPFKWSSKCKSAFEKVKQILSTAPVLAHYDPSKKIGVACDASPFVVSSILFMIDEYGNEQPLGYHSQLLNETQRRYSQIEKEGLSIIVSMKKFYKYLCARRFLLVTDHRPLVSIFGPKTQLPPFVATRLHHWCVFLSQFQYEVIYRKSELHGNADCLSRLVAPSSNKPAEEPMDATINFIASQQLDVLPVTASTIRNATARDPVLSKVQQLILYGWPSELQQQHKVLQPFFIRRQELSIIQGVIMWGIRVVVPSSLQQKIVQQLHECHFGIVKMKSLARQHVYWPNIDQHIEEIARSCLSCQHQAPNSPSSPLHPWQFPEKVWQRLHIDLAGPFLNRNWLIIMDAHTKWPEVICMYTNTTSSAIITKLTELFSRFGLPEQIVSDNGRQFISNEFESFLKANHVCHVLSSVYHPRSNGEAERFVRTFKDAMKSSDAPVDLRLQRFLVAYRNTPHSTTGSSPAELLQGRKLRTTLDLIRPDVATATRTHQANQEKGYNKREKAREFTINSSVWVKTFMKGEEKWSLGTIVERLGPVTYNIKVGDRVIKRHTDQIRTTHHALHPDSTERPITGPPSSSPPPASGQTTQETPLQSQGQHV